MFYADAIENARVLIAPAPDCKQVGFRYSSASGTAGMIAADYREPADPRQPALLLFFIMGHGSLFLRKSSELVVHRA